ncbi:transcription factor unc-3-like isoform X2 [Dysidea avara]|uniref:transcription factor unc-3-like isoform X2 n=1 Tax=Dysidea avara TaxID=196820 RepID=UPI0033232AAA
MDTLGHTITLRHHQYAMKFYKQPPSHLRKSNFFSFKLMMHDMDSQPIEVDNAKFVDFIDATEEDRTFSNGLIYKFDMIFKNKNNIEERVENKLFVRLVDSQTKELVPFEGITKNPDMKRVLVTHEVICSRCSQSKSCGNKMVTPSNPVIVDKYYMQVFAKCNQNCVKIAGNPRDSRRFRVAVYCPNTLGGIDPTYVALSDPMFVHNNSKYRSGIPQQPTTVPASKPPRLLRVEQEDKDCQPCIIRVFPNEGWTGGGNDICIIGEKFIEGMQIIFGSQQVPCKFISSNALSMTVPKRSLPGEVNITLYVNGEHHCTKSPGVYKYLAIDEPNIEDAFEKLGDLLNVSSKEFVLQKAIEFIENAQIRSGTLLPNSHTAFNFPTPSVSSLPSSLPFGSPSEYSTTAPTPVENSSNSSVFGHFVHSQRDIREGSPTNIPRGSPDYQMSQQSQNIVNMTDSELNRRQISTGSEDTLLRIARDPPTEPMQQEQRKRRRSSQYGGSKVPPPLQLAPAALSHAYSDIPPNVSLTCNTSEYLRDQSIPPVPCAVIITPEMMANGATQQAPVSNSGRPVESPHTQTKAAIDSPVLPQISLSPSVFARMMNTQEHDINGRQPLPNDGLSMTYLSSPGLVGASSNLNGLPQQQMTSYLQGGAFNQRLTTIPHYEHYITAPLSSPGVSMTFPPPTPSAMITPINVATLSCRFE